MRNTNWLANVFSWIHLVVEQADKPISLLVQVFLPFIAPLLPALITAKSLRIFMGLTDAETWIAVISFEFIGFLGMIAVVGALMRLINGDKKERLLRFNFLFYLIAYLIYLTTLITSNAILEFKNGASWERIIVILCLTVGLSVSAGILNASRLYQRDEKDDNYILRQERRQDRLKGKALKAGINVFASEVQLAQSGVQDTQLSRRDAQQVDRFRNVLGINGNWRTDQRKLTQDDLRWLKTADVLVIMQATGAAKRTAQKWKQSARERLG